MLRSLFSAISGLQAHQTKLDVTGNNIANVNTVGYKTSSTVFEDTLSQVLRNGTSPNGETAGTNPAQVGLGVQVAGITTNFAQGSTQSTGRALDFMISGDGFFVTNSGGEQQYTRAGSFNVDKLGTLATPDGSALQGWTATGGVVDTNKPLGNLQIPIGDVLAPEQTVNNKITGNLSADNPAAQQMQITAYDAQGNPHQMNYSFTPTAGTPNAWSLQVTEKMPDGTTKSLGTTPLSFDAKTGAIAPTTTTFDPSADGDDNWTGTPPTITVDLSQVTQFGGKTSVARVDPDTGAGCAMGTLQTWTLSPDGTIVGKYSNDQSRTLGQLAMATFSNPNGLEKAGNSSFRAANNSGLAQIGLPNSGGRGSLTSGALEMSNVDLAQEFTSLIIAQRGFQANSKVITTSDEILQSLVQMKQ